MNWWEGEGLESNSIQEAQRQDDRRQERDIQEANDTLSYDELKDLGIPRLTVSRLRSCDLHTHEERHAIATRLAHLGLRVGV